MMTKIAANQNTPLVRKDLDEAVDAILTGMQKMFDKHNQEQEESFQSVENRFDLLNKKIDNVEVSLKDEINGLKADLSTTVSKGEFNQLKSKVDKHLPAN